MNKTIRLMLALGLVMMATSACKTKQKVTKIPAGANIEATAPTPTPAPKPTVSVPIAAPTTYTEREETRNENFSLIEGENSDVMKFKYHVVVGSFNSQVNAKGLQASLNAEGNKAVVVVNEKGMFRVLIASFNDYKMAHVRIKEISVRFPDAWVLVQK